MRPGSQYQRTCPQREKAPKRCLLLVCQLFLLCNDQLGYGRTVRRLQACKVAAGLRAAHIPNQAALTGKPVRQPRSPAENP